MVKRSLIASSTGVEKAKKAFKRKGWTQEYLAAEVGLQTRQPIWKFFSGKPIYRHVFIEICFALDLNPEEIALASEENLNQNTDHQNLDLWVENLRQSQAKTLQYQCGLVQMLDVTRPIELEDIYVDVNILPEIPHRRWLEISDFPSASEYSRLGLIKIPQQRIPVITVLEQYKHLVILGQPGAGKTTLLQALAIQCNQGSWRKDLLPIFIRLKNLSEDTLRLNSNNFLNDLFSYSPAENIAQLEQLLLKGKVLLLLDGLDEVPAKSQILLIQKLQNFFEKYYNITCLITCRPAAYQYRLPNFTEIELADFTDQQISSFVSKFFQIVNHCSLFSRTCSNPEILAQQFLQQIQKNENRSIRELIKTPILLNLSCLVFQQKAEFPHNLIKLYQQGLDILLNRWDITRGIQRDSEQCNFSVPEKLSLLSYLAYVMLKKDQYFIEQKNLQKYVIYYLIHHKKSQKDRNELEQYVIKILKTIESQHGILVEQARGIYSFSHLTFQEYLASHWIAHHPETSVFQTLINHLYNPNWRNIILMTCSLLPNSETFLTAIQQKIQQDIAQDLECVLFLRWVQQQAKPWQDSKKLILVQGVLFSFGMLRNVRLQQRSLKGLTLAIALLQELLFWVDFQRIITPLRVENLAEAWLKGRELANQWGENLQVQLSSRKISYVRVQQSMLKRDLQGLCELSLGGELAVSLNDLIMDLPSLEMKTEPLKKWWETEGNIWLEKLQNVLSQQGYGQVLMPLGDRQRQALLQFYSAQVLLVEGLERAIDLSPDVRSHFESKLFHVA
ncbi:NACHT domain-containing NTPase [Spirulina subsalsa FACHB-351]|uniref:NACHT domain-containing NTPase n=1 Tax=Spirulina subsalsa FACHB-351 TaxID=234711 RepID=A0ABT3L0N2_9CYAN|nr:NACHT domain-containing NTPase [Spirulina subsalsa]MCW6035040.1 NACHT domain-containing NTPase [Spirulina subsalsa FACHB-351]